MTCPLHPYSPEGGRRCYFQRHYLIVQQYAVRIPGWPLGSGAVFADQENEDVRWYFSKSDDEYLALSRLYLDNPDTLKNIETYTDVIREESCRYIKNLKLEDMSHSDIRAAYETHNQYYIRHLRMASTLRHVDRAVLLSLSEYTENKRRHFFEMTGLPTKPTSPLREHYAIQKAKEKIKQGTGYATELATQLMQQFAWTSLGYHNEQPRTEHTYTAMITADADARNDALEKNHIEKEKFIDSLPPEKQKLARIVGEIAFLKDHFKFSINEFQYRAQPLLDAVAQSIEKTFEELMWYTPQEVSQLLKNEFVPTHDMTARIRHNAVVCDLENRVELFEGVDADTYVRTHLQTQRTQGIPTTLHGRSACRGSAQGKARIVQSPSKTSDFKKGDILVTMNTTPEYLPLMRRAGAIIAEEGGITSHASVTARELNIPCIVGVYNATKIIKNDDLLDVDATNGLLQVVKGDTR